MLDMEPEQRAAAGVFLAFQAPIELPGVNNANFLRTALNAIRRAHGESELDAVQFLKLARAASKQLAMPADMLKRNVNVGFSGGEKKRNEVLQMAILRPKLAILDETDSGLDIDALKIVADGVNALRGPEFSALVITHHQRLLDYLVPNRVHVLTNGRIVRSGGPESGKGTGKEWLRRPDRGGRVSTGAAGFLQRYEELIGRLPGDSALRAAAAAAFRESGLPGGTQQRRIEAWKFTSLRPLAEAKFQPAPSPRHEAETMLARLPILDAPRIVFVDGAMRADLSAMPPAGFARFAEQPDFGTLTWPDREPMVALNTMLAIDGAALDVPPGVDGGVVQLVSIAGGEADYHPRHSIRLGKGSQLTVVEISVGQGAYLLNTLAEIHVAEGAHLTHIRLQDEALTAFHVSTTYADVEAGGTYDSFTLNLGARLSRTEVHAQLSGARADRSPERRANPGWRAARRFHHRRWPCRAGLHLPPDGQERARRSLSWRVPGQDRGRPRCPEDRRLPDEPGVAAVALRRSQLKARTGNIRGRREMQPRRHGRGARRRADVLPPQPGNSRRRGQVYPGARLSRRGAGCCCG